MGLGSGVSYSCPENQSRAMERSDVCHRCPDQTPYLSASARSALDTYSSTLFEIWNGVEGSKTRFQLAGQAPPPLSAPDLPPIELGNVPDR